MARRSPQRALFFVDPVLTLEGLADLNRIRHDLGPRGRCERHSRSHPDGGPIGAIIQITTASVVPEEGARTASTSRIRAGQVTRLRASP